jgi:hypothetical protein
MIEVFYEALNYEVLSEDEAYGLGLFSVALKCIF